LVKRTTEGQATTGEKRKGLSMTNIHEIMEDAVSMTKKLKPEYDRSTRSGHGYPRVWQQPMSIHVKHEVDIFVSRRRFNTH
jgi:hypothetical protein